MAARIPALERNGAANSEMPAHVIAMRIQTDVRAASVDGLEPALGDSEITKVAIKKGGRWELRQWHLAELLLEPDGDNLTLSLEV